MNEKPKSIWRKPGIGLRWFYAWPILIAAAFFTIFVVGALTGSLPRGLSWEEWVTALVFILVVILVVAFAFLGLWAFIRWLIRSRNFKRFIFGVACFITLMALFYAEEDWRGKHELEKFKREWEAKGEKFDYASLIPPPVPDDQNFAKAPIWVEAMKTSRLAMPLGSARSVWPLDRNGNWAIPTLTDLKGWQSYYRSLAATTNLFPVAPQPQTPAQDVLLALSKYDSTIEELRQAGQRPYSRFPLDYAPGLPFDASVLVRTLGPLHGCGQVLQLRAIAELQNGESDKALDDVKFMLRLADAIRTEPFLISHLVRIATVQKALQPVYEGLAEHKWSDAQLAQLDSEFAKLDFLADYELSMRGERACEISWLEYVRRTRELSAGLSNPYDSGPTPEYRRILSHLIMPDAVFYQNELTVARMQQQCILPMADPADRTVSPSKVQQSQSEVNRYLQHHWWWPNKIFARILMPGFQNAVIRFAYAQESVDLARVAIALERYRLAHGEHPESLDALAPQFIANLPHDIINGQPLHYRRTADGQFVLYSVGWNETDDGGVVALTKAGNLDNRKGDWVWKYPAK
jgi:hypothetical protein